MGASYSEASPAGEASYRPGSSPDFDRLYRASYPRLVRTLTALLRDGAAAEDCVQEAFVRAFKAWPRYRPDAPAEAWLHRIALTWPPPTVATSGCARLGKCYAGSG